MLSAVIPKYKSERWETSSRASGRLRGLGGNLYLLRDDFCRLRVYGQPVVPRGGSRGRVTNRCRSSGTGEQVAFPEGTLRLTLPFVVRRKNRTQKTQYTFDANGDVNGLQLDPQIRLFNFDCAIDGRGELRSTSQHRSRDRKHACVDFFQRTQSGCAWHGERADRIPRLRRLHLFQPARWNHGQFRVRWRRRPHS